MTRATYHHGDLEAEALRAAADWVRERGPDALSMRALARELGVSHKALYRYFEDRSALMLAVAARGFDALCDAITGELGAAVSDELAFVEAYVGFALEAPHRYRAMFDVPHGTFDDHPALWPSVKRLVDLSREIYGPRMPGVSEVVLRDRIVSIWAQAHGLIELYLGGALRASDAVQARGYIVSRVVDVQSAWLETTPKGP